MAPLIQLNQDLVVDAVQRLALLRLTIDVGGTVVRTGATVGWVSRLERSQLLTRCWPTWPRAGTSCG